MKKIIKILAITISTIVAIIIAGGFVIGYFYNDKVTNYIVKELNKKINVEINVDKVNFSVLRKFPNASIEFVNIIAKPAIEFQKSDFKDSFSDTLISAKQLYLMFNIWDIFNDNYSIKTIELSQGTSNILFDNYGNENYIFWKTDSESSASNFNLSLNNIHIKDFTIRIKNNINKFEFTSNINDLIVSGEFSNKEFNLSNKGTAYVNNLIIDDINYLKNQNINVDLVLDVKGDNYSIKKGKLGISDLQLVSNGDFYLGNKSSINMTIEGAELNLNSFLSIIPENLKLKFENYYSTGELYFKSEIKGEISGRNIPHIEANFGITNGIIEQNNSNLVLSDVNFTGRYTNGANSSISTTLFKVSDFSCNLGRSTITANYLIEDFNNPNIQFTTYANLDLEEFNEFFPIDTISQINGNLDLQINFSGNINDIANISSNDFRNADLQGKLVFDSTNIAFINSSVFYNNIFSSLSFSNNIVNVDSLNFNINNNDFRINGKFKNLINYILFDDEQTYIVGKLKSNNIDFNELILLFSETENTESQEIFPENIEIRLNSEIKHFEYEKFIADNVKAIIFYKNNNLDIINFALESMQGSISGKARLLKKDVQTIGLKTILSLKNVDITKLFNSFNNFGQDYITQKHLNGSITADLDFYSDFDNKFNIDENKINVESNLSIKNGELNNFEPAKELAKFIELSELENIKFSDLRNEIVIKDRKILIPDMKIESSAFDVDLSGEHSFDNDIDYHLKVLLSDVLSKKAKKKKAQNKEFGVEEDDGLGRTSLFIAIKGTVDDYKVSYDSKKVKEHIKESLVKEKQTIKNILNEEFGWFKKDTTIKNNHTKEIEKSNNPNNVKTENDEFIIRWNEDENSELFEEDEDDE